MYIYFIPSNFNFNALAFIICKNVRSLHTGFWLCLGLPSSDKGSFLYFFQSYHYFKVLLFFIYVLIDFFNYLNLYFILIEHNNLENKKIDNKDHKNIKLLEKYGKLKHRKVKYRFS